MTVIQNKNETLFNLFPTCVEQAHHITFFFRWRQASSKQLRGVQKKGTKLSGRGNGQTYRTEANKNETVRLRPAGTSITPGLFVIFIYPAKGHCSSIDLIFSVY